MENEVVAVGGGSADEGGGAGGSGDGVLYGAEHRQHAQEVISAHLSQDWTVRDGLIAEYCTDSCEMLACLLDFVVVSVGTGGVETAKPRFAVQQWMLGDVVAEIANCRGVAAEAVALELLEDEVVTSLGGGVEACFVRAAQTTLVSHMVSRRTRQPWGIATGSDDQTLAQLTLGANLLLWHLCWVAAEELGVPRVVPILLPYLQRILQMGADGNGETLDVFTHRLWMHHLRRDQASHMTDC